MTARYNLETRLDALETGAGVRGPISFSRV
jgi:hypothetical protein